MLALFCIHCQKTKPSFKFNQDFLRNLDGAGAWCLDCKRAEHSRRALLKQSGGEQDARDWGRHTTTPEEKMTMKRDNLLRELFS